MLVFVYFAAKFQKNRTNKRKCEHFVNGIAEKDRVFKNNLDRYR